MKICLALSLLMISNAAEEVNAPAFITAVSGDVEIFRTLNAQTIPAGLDIGLFKGDSLKTGADGEVTIVYNNGKILSICKGAALEINDPPVDSAARGGPDTGTGVQPPAAASSNPYFSDGEQSAGMALFKCSFSGERIALIASVRGPEDSTNIVIYEPGNTAITTTRPVFVWSRHPEADSYIVVCQKSGMPVWAVTTADTVLQYPDAQAELVPGNYLMKAIVRTGTDTLTLTERFFKILKPEKIASINEALAMIRAQNPDSFTLHFLSAKIYEQEYMHSSAIKEYERLLELRPDLPFIHAVLSDLYNKYGLSRIGNLHDDRYKELTGKK